MFVLYSCGYTEYAWRLNVKDGKNKNTDGFGRFNEYGSPPLRQLVNVYGTPAMRSTVVQPAGLSVGVYFGAKVFQHYKRNGHSGMERITTLTTEQAKQ